MKKGILFLISGPSGVGKKTILDCFMHKPKLQIAYSISMTTRPKRPSEVAGVDYFFVTKEYFLEQIAKKNTLEYAEFFGNYYGTPKSYVLEQLNQGKNVLLEIEVIGAKQIMAQMPECVSIFILPPSINELENRLIKRGTESFDKIQTRLKKAEDEVELKKLYKYNVYNDVLETAAKEVEAIIWKEINK